MPKNLFGFFNTNIGRVLQICEEELGRDKVQILTGRDMPANRRCYIIMGVDTLNADRCKAFASCRATLVVIDCLPALNRIQGIDILDHGPSELGAWPVKRPRLTPLVRSLRAQPQRIELHVDADGALEQLMESVRACGILDRVLAAAKAMRPIDRPTLHLNVARCVVGEIGVNALQRRALDGKVSDAIADALTAVLSSDVAKRLGRAMMAHVGGVDAAIAAEENSVEAFEIRFLCNHLSRRPVDKSSSSAQQARQKVLRRPQRASKQSTKIRRSRVSA